VHPETCWNAGSGRTPDPDRAPLASSIAEALLDGAMLQPLESVLNGARSFLQLERVSFPRLIEELAQYADPQTGAVPLAGLTATLESVFLASHRGLAAKAESSADALAREVASTDHVIELADHIYSMFDSSSENGSGSVDFVEVRVSE
jgi:hypothetical protein